MNLVIELEPWHWLSMALLLLGAEALGSGGFLIGLCVAGLVNATLLYFYPDLSWQFQLTSFAVGSVLASLAYWHFFRDYNQATDRPQLNDRAAQLIGDRFTLENDINNGQGRVQLSDTFWKVQVDSKEDHHLNLATGTMVEIVGSDGMILLIKPV